MMNLIAENLILPSGSQMQEEEESAPQSMLVALPVSTHQQFRRTTAMFTLKRTKNKSTGWVIWQALSILIPNTISLTGILTYGQRCPKGTAFGAVSGSITRLGMTMRLTLSSCWARTQPLHIRRCTARLLASIIIIRLVRIGHEATMTTRLSGSQGG